MLVLAAVTRKLAVISGWPWPGVSSAAVESSAATNTVRRTDREVAVGGSAIGRHLQVLTIYFEGTPPHSIAAAITYTRQSGVLGRKPVADLLAWGV